jgi:hypothetical protein
MEGLGATGRELDAKSRMDAGEGCHEVPDLFLRLSDAFTAIEVRLERLSVRIDFGQQYLVGVVVRHQDLESQRTRFVAQ